MAEFVSGSLDSVVFWDAKNFTKKRSAQPFRNSTSHLSSLTWNSTNSQLAVVPKKGERIALCEFHEAIMTWDYLVNMEGRHFTSGCLLHNSRYMASGSSDYNVCVWDLKNKTIFRNFPGHTSLVTSITRNHNDRWIVSGGKDGSLIMHTVDNSSAWQLLQSPSKEPNRGINRLSFSLVEKGHLGSVSEDGVVSVWSVESQRLLRKYSSPHTGPATDLCFSPSNNMLMISVGMDSKIKCYDIQTRKIVTEVSSPSPLTSVTMLKDGSTLLAGGADGLLYVYELRTVKYPKSTHPGHKTAITCITQQSYSKQSSRSSRTSRSNSSSKSKHTPSALDSPQAVAGGEAIKGVQLEGSAGDGFRTDSLVITPFVTHPPPSSSSHAARTEFADTAVTVATPASDQSHISSIFSPIDPNLVTPIDTKIKAVQGRADAITPPDVTPFITQSMAPPTAAVPPTAVPTTNSQISAKSVPSSFPTSSSPSTFTTQAASTIPSTLPTTTTATTTASALPVATHSQFIPTTTTTTTTTTAADASGIFSPLDNYYGVHSRQPVASPLLISHTQPAPSQHHHHHHHTTTQEQGGRSVVVGRHEQLIRDPQNTDFPDGDSMSPSSGHLTGPPPTTKTVAMPTRGSPVSSDPGERELPEEAFAQHYTSTLPTGSTHSIGSAHSLFSSLPDLSGGSVNTSSTDVSSLVDQTESTLLVEQQQHHGMAEPPPPPPPRNNPIPPTNGIQMKYLDNMMRDAHEETVQALHRDMRALSVENTRFFCALQQQSSNQYHALMEKLDRLQEEMKLVQEMVHQHMPKH